MDVAIVTGAASGIGLAISRKLVEIGCRVYGLGGNFVNTPYSHEYFIPTPCELTDIEAIKEKVEQILAKEGGVFILVNNAKYFGSKPFLDEVNLAEFETVIRINLLCPLILTRLALPSLEKLQGFIINIASGSPESARGGPAGASAAGGLRWMGEALFEECRGSGVKVTTIFPQANRQVPVKPETHSEGSQTTIAPDAVARAVERIIRESDENVITEIVIRPQRLTEKPIPAPLLIPSPKIPKAITPDRPTSTLRALAEAEEAITSAAKKARKTSKKDMPKRVKSEERKSQESSSTAREPVLQKTPSSRRRIKQAPKKPGGGEIAQKKTKAKDSSQTTKPRAKSKRSSQENASSSVVPPQKLQSRKTKGPRPDPKRNRKITPKPTS
ncbi:MAG: putative oxidoreductase [Candidatus Moanabacter tarae]|uniref:Putative oxidoreductase n=1 Tax=Candidatus Moanibacter tarae TaxID=2200854 RepID=A0A2Z4AHQ7_9BACT|nr:MAG: putative oxidoreductase [Candidatus Moanabacter tarae]|tara:strand:+ start:7283 stop:8440 length:1158 start_codon:yes stop_codon:yes gene_type:complete